MPDPQTPAATIDQTTRQDALATLMAPYSIPNPVTALTPDDDAS
jgi:hypothetical protein